MIRDIHSSFPRRSITTFQTVPRITILSTGCTLSAMSFSFAAELFPFTKNLRETIKSNVGQNVVPTRKLDGEGKLWLIPA